MKINVLNIDLNVIINYLYISDSDVFFSYRPYKTGGFNGQAAAMHCFCKEISGT